MWGWNEKGQLGLTVSPDNDDDSRKIQCQALPALVNLPGDLDVLAVSCGTRHTAIVAGKRLDLRTVPTFVIAHTFCAPRDTHVSYR